MLAVVIIFFWRLLVQKEMDLAVASTAVAMLLVIAFAVRSYYKPSRATCGVSRAHLTCDPGNSQSGYNHVVAVITFANSVKPETFKQRFIKAIVETESCFRTRMFFTRTGMEWRAAPSTWRPEDNFFVCGSVRRDSLEDMVAKILSGPTDLTKPCWELHFIERVFDNSADDSTSCIVLKYHHAMADGFTMIQRMVARIRPLDASKPITEMFPPTPPKHSRPSSLVGKIWRFVNSTMSILRMQPDIPGLFRSAKQRLPGESLNVSLSSQLNLLTIKEIARNMSTGNSRMSVNDVITCIITRAFRLYSLNRGVSKPIDLTSVVWVSLNKDITVEEEWDNSNLGFAYVKLPLSVNSAKDCLRECHRRLSALKSSAEPLVINTTLKLLGSLPIAIGKTVSTYTADVASVSMSNLIGPNSPVYWPVIDSDVTGSGLVDSVYFATSPPFRYGPLVSVISYCGTFYLSLSARDSLLTKSDLDWISGEGITLALNELNS